MAESNGFDKPNGSNGAGNGGGGHRPGLTGRFLVTFVPGSAEQAKALLENTAGLKTVSARDAGGAPPGGENMVFEEIGVAVVSAQPNQHKKLMAAAADAAVAVSIVEPERIVYASMLGVTPSAGERRPVSRGRAAANGLDAPPPLNEPPLEATALSADFLRGYAAAVQGMLQATAGSGALLKQSAREVAATQGATWGLQATRVLESSRSGLGIKVAVLDTGFDLHHPDFAGRNVVSRSFVAGESAQDGHGHGTHCVGVSCGPRHPSIGPRYGVAYGADIYVGKVLNNAGSGVDGDILAGINWAVAQGCEIISMSLGSPVEQGEPFSQAYQNAATLAEAKGTLIVAAAGNESDRPDFVASVGHPANCPTILAVAALDSALKVAYFSCGGINGSGGEVNIAAPGVDVYSSWPMPLRYNTISGTSMATPCTAGICALFAEASGLRGLALANFVLRHARRMSPIRDFGWGLAQAL